MDTVLSRLTALKERIEGTEALIEIDLDHRRNELVAFDLVRLAVMVQCSECQERSISRSPGLTAAPCGLLVARLSHAQRDSLFRPSSAADTAYHHQICLLHRVSSTLHCTLIGPSNGNLFATVVSAMTASCLGSQHLLS